MEKSEGRKGGLETHAFWEVRVLRYGLGGFAGGAFFCLVWWYLRLGWVMV